MVKIFNHLEKNSSSHDVCFNSNTASRVAELMCYK